MVKGVLNEGEGFPEVVSNLLGLVSFVAVLVLLSAQFMKERD